VLLPVVVLIAAAAVLAAGAGAVTLKKSPSTVKITSGNGSNFTIKVGSSNMTCLKKRKVQLFREGSKVGAGTTDDSGVANLPGSYVDGNYTSMVKANRHCKGARSKSQHF
jgi:hypothetical protein